MSGSARVQSAEAVKAFRPRLWKFAEAVTQSVGEAEGELHHTVQWLEQRAAPHWQRELRRRHQLLQEAKQALNNRKLYKSADGSRASAVEQEQAYAAAKRSYEEAEQKLEAVKRWRRELDRRASEFKPALQSLARLAEHHIPAAVAQLDKLIASLEAYLAVAPPVTKGDPSSPENEGDSVARAQVVEPAQGDSPENAEPPNHKDDNADPSPEQSR